MSSLLIQPRRSFVLGVLFLALHACATVVLCMQATQYVWLLGVLPFVFLSAFLMLRRHAFLLDRNSIVCCWPEQRGQWYVQCASSPTPVLCELCDTFVSRYLVVFKFRVEKRRSLCVLLSYDSVSRGVLRALRAHRVN